jgi:hypothetical protein
LISVIWISCHRITCKIKWQFHFLSQYSGTCHKHEV